MKFQTAHDSYLDQNQGSCEAGREAGDTALTFPVRGGYHCTMYTLRAHCFVCLLTGTEPVILNVIM